MTTRPVLWRMSENVSTGGRTHVQPLAVRGGLAVVAAVVANAALVAVSDAVGVAPELQALTYPPVVFLSAVGATGSVVVYGLLGRYVDDVGGTFRRVAAAVLGLSFVPDLALLAVDEAATVLGVLLLMLMHVVVAGAAVGALVYWSRER